jgi:hypothetical protein
MTSQALAKCLALLQGPARMSKNFFIFFCNPNADREHRILNFYRSVKQPLALSGRYGKYPYYIEEQWETTPLPHPILLDSCETYVDTAKPNLLPKIAAPSHKQIFLCKHYRALLRIRDVYP